MVGTLNPRWSVLFPRQLSHFERDMDQLMERFAGNGNGSPAAVTSPANLWEEEGKWCVELELPGVKQDAIDITLEKNVLRVTATRPAPEGERKYLHAERTYGHYKRHFTLPETVDPDGIEALLADGVLHLTLTKKPEAQPKKIEVNQIKTV
jgi:HSP20 family protein